METGGEPTAVFFTMPRWSGPCILCLFLAAYLAPLGMRPLFRPDEDRYAEIPREMLATGDWVVPHLNGIPYLEKPPLGYWLTAISIRLFGHTAFAVRLPAALSAGVTALAIFLLARRFWCGRIPALLPAAVLLTSAQFYTLGCYAVLDMPLTMFLSSGMVFFYYAYQEHHRGRRALYLALFGACCGGALLTKGLLAFVIPCIVLVPFLVWERRAGAFLRLAWIPLLTAGLVMAPWAILIHLREPGFWHRFLWDQHIRRFLSPEAGHARPFWFFLPVILGSALPWTALVPAAVWGLRLDGFRDPLKRLALCWFVFPFLFYSACSVKLFSYILPCFPPLALLIAAGLPVYLAAGKERAFAGGARVLAGVLLVGAAAMAAWHVRGLQDALYGPGEGWKLAWIVGALGGSALLIWLAARPQAGLLRRIALFSAASWLIMVTLHFVLPRAVEEWAAPGRLLARNAARVRPDGPLFACTNSFRSVCWQYHRSDVRLVGEIGEVGSGGSRDTARARRIRYARFPAYVAACPADTLVTVVMTPWLFHRIRGILPKPVYEDSVAGYLFLQYRTTMPSRERP